MSREPPTPIRPGASHADLDTAALEHAVNEAALQRALWGLVRKLAAWLGLPLAGGLAGYGAGSSRVDEPTHREQPASGPAPAHDPDTCTPAEREQLLEAQERASRHALAAVDACRELAETRKDPRP